MDYERDGKGHDRKSSCQTGLKENCDPYTFTILTTGDGKQTMHLTTCLSADGKTMTRTGQTQKPQGQAQQDVFVYERQ